MLFAGQIRSFWGRILSVAILKRGRILWSRPAFAKIEQHNRMEECRRLSIVQTMSVLDL